MSSISEKLNNNLLKIHKTHFFQSNVIFIVKMTHLMRWTLQEWSDSSKNIKVRGRKSRLPHMWNTAVTDLQPCHLCCNCSWPSDLWPADVCTETCLARAFSIPAKLWLGSLSVYQKSTVRLFHVEAASCRTFLCICLYWSLLALI